MLKTKLPTNIAKTFEKNNNIRIVLVFILIITYLIIGNINNTKAEVWNKEAITTKTQYNSGRFLSITAKENPQYIIPAANEDLSADIRLKWNPPVAKNRRKNNQYEFVGIYFRANTYKVIMIKADCPTIACQ